MDIWASLFLLPRSDNVVSDCCLSLSLLEESRPKISSIWRQSLTVSYYTSPPTRKIPGVENSPAYDLLGSAVFNFSINHPSLQFRCLCTCPINTLLFTYSVFNSAVNGPRVTFISKLPGFQQRRCCPGGGGRSASGWASADWLRPTRGGVHKPGGPGVQPVHKPPGGLQRPDVHKLVVYQPNQPLHNPMVDQPVHKAPIGHDQGPPLQTQWIAWITDGHIHNRGGPPCTTP